MNVCLQLRILLLWTHLDTLSNKYKIALSKKYVIHFLRFNAHSFSV